MSLPVVPSSIERGPPPLALYLSQLENEELAAILLKAARFGFQAFYTDDTAERLAIYRASTMFATITGIWNKSSRAHLFGMDYRVHDGALEMGRQEAIKGAVHPFSEACSLMMDNLHGDCHYSTL